MNNIYCCVMTTYLKGHPVDEIALLSKHKFGPLVSIVEEYFHLVTEEVKKVISRGPA